MTKIAYDRSRWLEDNINYFQWLQLTTGHRRSRNCTPERVNSRRKPRELRDQLAQKARRRHRRWWSWVRDKINWVRSPAPAPTMDRVILPLNAAISWIKGEVRDVLRVSTVMTTILLFEGSAPIPVCVYTYSSSNLEEAHLQKHSRANLRLLVPTEEDLARTKCTYRGDTLRIKHSYCHEHLHKRSALMEMTLHDWRTLRMRSFPSIEANL